MAGEAGHIRLSKEGPVGYGKEGSFEGFCSGGGIAQLEKERQKKPFRKENSLFSAKIKKNLKISAPATIAEAAEKGDPLAMEIFETVAKGWEKAFLS